MTLTKIELTPRIGTEIVADREVLLNGSAAAEINDLLSQRGILVFRGTNFTDEEQVAFTETLGRLQADGTEAVFKVSLDKNESSYGEFIAQYLRSTFFWHIDSIHEEYLVRASILRACRLPSDGSGATEFCNTYAAYEDLPEDEKTAIDQLKVVHSLESAQRMIFPEPSYQQLLMWQQMTRTHPLVWHHKSGRNSLVLGMTASHIEGMPEREGRALLCKLREWATQPQYVYHHDWEVGDLIMWDNTGTMHRVMPYAFDSGRMMHRTKLAGEEPIAA